jgi:cobalamin synthase
MREWRIAWILTGVVTMYLLSNVGFMLFGALVILFEQLLTGKTRWGQKMLRKPHLWYSGWWLAFILSIASAGYIKSATTLLVALAIATLVISKLGKKRGKRFSRKSHRPKVESKEEA